MDEATGLSEAEAASRLAAEGPNALPTAGRRSGAAIVLLGSTATKVLHISKTPVLLVR